MTKRIVLAAVSLAVAAGFLVSGAEAKVRLVYRHGGQAYFETYYPGREYVPPPSYYRYFDGADQADPYDAADDPAFDESYYDPYYLPPSHPSVRKLRRERLPASLPVKSVKKTAVPQTKAPDSTASISKPTATGSVNCDKASQIVSGYGFGDVKATDCQGQVFEFNATRDGKKFIVKLSAASGELTEVRKID